MPAQAQSGGNVVSVCSGVSLPRSVVTDIVSPVVSGLASPLENAVNGLLGILVPQLNINTTQLLNNAASGQPITLQVLNRNGTVVGPSDPCQAAADGFSLNTQGGISIGGNQITGLGANGSSSFAGHIDAVALGNNARSETGAVSSVAIGANSQVTVSNSVALGAGSQATRGAVGSYTAVGLSGAQSSAGEVSVGAPGAARQITNVAAGRDDTDAVNVAQLRGVNDRVGTAETNITNIDNRVSNVETNISTTNTQVTNISNRVTSAETNITNNSTQITNVSTRVTNAETNITALQTTAVMYDDNVTYGAATLRGTNGTRLRNVADGDVNSTSRDAVNGSQLNATNVRVSNVENITSTHTTQISNLQSQVNNNNSSVTDIDNRVTNINNTINNVDQRVTNNSTAISNVDQRVTNVTSTINTRLTVHDEAFTEINVRLAGHDQDINELRSAVGSGGNPQAVVYDTDGNGNRVNRVTLAGGNTNAPVAIGNVAAGRVAANSTDAVNGSQLNATNERIAAVEQTGIRYDDATQARATLGGANGTVLANVAAGEVSATSTEAINGSQLHATQQMATQARTTSQAAMTMASNSVQYDTQGRTVTFGPGGGPVSLRNVADGTVATDAVNLGQLQSGMQSTLSESMAYTDSRFTQMNLDIGGLRQDSRSGTAGAMALSGLPQGTPGANMIAMGVGHFEGETALAIGGSAGFRDGHTVVRFGATYNSRGSAGANAGVGYSF